MRIVTGTLAAALMASGAVLGAACVGAALYFSGWSFVAIAKAVVS